MTTEQDVRPRKGPEVRDATDFPTAAFMFDGAGLVQPVAATVATPTSGKAFLLVAGSLASPEFKVWINSNLDPLAAEHLTANDQHSRCTVLDDRALVAFRVLRARSDPQNLSKQTVSIWLERHRIVVASKVPLGEVVGLAHWQQAGHAPFSPAEFIARLGTRAADRVEPFVEHLGDELDNIEEAMMSDHGHEERERLTRLRRSLISLRRVLWPQRDVLNTLEIEDLSFLTERDRARLKDAAARNARLGDELQVLAERAGLIHEQVLDTRAEQMNKTMLVLTAATVIAMPMTVVSGLLGMNVDGIPFARNPEAFWIVVVALAALGTGMVWFMRGRKWL